MYDTYPKFSLGLVAALLIAALFLPAVMVFPFGGFKTAAGVQIALMLLVLVVIRMILLPDQQTWLDAARFPLALFAAVTALSFSPQDAVWDVIRNYSFVPMVIGTAIGIAVMSRRPKYLGFSVNRQFWSVLAAIFFLALVNHFFWFPQAQGAAVVADLVALAGLANWSVFGQAPSNGNLGQRVLNVLSLTLCIGTVSWMMRPLTDGSYDAVTSVIIVMVQFPIFWLFYPYLEHRLQPK